MKIKNKLITWISTLLIGGAIIAGAAFAHTSANVDKLGLLTRAIENDTVEQLQKARGDIIIQSGYTHSGALIDNGVYMWGGNRYGQLGTGDTRNRSVPTRININATGTVTSLELGTNHSGIIVDGKVFTWGYNEFGQLGNGYRTNTSTPVQVLTGASSLSLGVTHSGAIVNGKIYMWGQNQNGQIGNGINDNVNCVTNPTLVRDTYIRNMYALELSTGLYHSGAILRSGNKTILFTWGLNDFGQLGLGDTTQRNAPTQVNYFINMSGTLKSLSLGGFNSSVIINNQLYTWGFNQFGQIGNGTSGTSYATPIFVLSNANSVQISKNSDTVLAITTSNSLYMWGRDQNVYSPKFIRNNVSQVSAGFFLFGAVIDNKLFTWGQNTEGGLGNGSVGGNAIATPTMINININRAINLNASNSDPNNLRNRVVYNITDSEIRSIIQNPINQIDLPIGNYNLLNTQTISYASNISGRITTRVEAAFPVTTNVIIDGFLPVKETEHATIIPKNSLTAQGVAHFAGNEINQLVADANNDSSGKNNKFAQWIIDNSSTIIGNTSNQYTQDFPKGTKITKVSNVSVANGVTGEISFKIQVDKYYKKSGANLVLSTTSDTPITLKNPITLSGFKSTLKSESTVISSSNRNLNAKELLDSFGDTGAIISGDGLTNLKKYIDLSSFPTNATFRIINPRLHGTNLSFKIEATGYYDDNGILRNGSKTYLELTIDNLLDSQSKIEKKLGDVTTPPKVILQNIGYDSKNPQTPVIKNELEKYVNLISFPSNINTDYTLTDVKIEPTKLSFKLMTSNQLNSSGEILYTSVTPTLFTFTDLDLGETTSIKVKTLYDKKVLIGDFEKNLKIKADKTFDEIEMRKYVNFNEVVDGTKYTLDNLNRNGTEITFNIIADQTMSGGVIDSNKKSFPIVINGLSTIPNSRDGIFLRKEIIGNDDSSGQFNGDEIAKQIESNITQGAVIAYNDQLWNQLVDVSIYPIDTTFTIDSIEADHHGGAFSTFEILTTPSNYYENNTTMDKPAPQTMIIINNLKFIPTSFKIKDKLPNMDPYQFFKYINHNDVTKSFDPLKLQEFLTLTSFDLSDPGVTTRLIEPNIIDNEITFRLEVLNRVGEDGLVVSGASNQASDPINVELNISLIITSGASNGYIYPLAAILGTSIGGGVGLWLVILLILLSLIRNAKNKENAAMKISDIEIDEIE